METPWNKTRPLAEKTVAAWWLKIKLMKDDVIIHWAGSGRKPEPREYLVVANYLLGGLSSSSG
jgi:hypothetical protein